VSGKPSPRESRSLILSALDVAAGRVNLAEVDDLGIASSVWGGGCRVTADRDTSPGPWLFALS
jgi:hypothetical protein